METGQSPSKFSVKPLATFDEIWEKILTILNSQDREEADKAESEINEPYFGAKEITVRRSDRSIIAFASLSEIQNNSDEWAVYKER